MNKLHLQICNIVLFGAGVKWLTFFGLVILSLMSYTMIHPESIKKTVYTYEVVNCKVNGDKMECTN